MRRPLFSRRQSRAWASILLLMIGSCGWAVPGVLDDVHRPFRMILRDYVRPVVGYDKSQRYVRSQVKYGLLRDSGAWREYMRGLRRFEAAKIKTASEADRKAFWLNTYNVLVLESLARAYPLPLGSGGAGNVRALPDLFTRVHPVAREEISLSDIRLKLEEFHDPRVWFAITHGTVGSPALPSAPYNATTVEDQLDEGVRNFLADPTRFRLDRQNNQIFLSEWVREFGSGFASPGLSIPPALFSYSSADRPILALLLRYMREQDRAYILENKPAISYVPVDWSLNIAL